MSVDGIFLVSSESKDSYCLDPIENALTSRFDVVHSINFFDDLTCNNGALLRYFVEARFPAVIISSSVTIDLLSLIRPRETFLCLGVEHGIAPFKAYTYGKHLLSSDFYLAPTQGWAERLARLYPDERSKIRIGGYPKIEVIREHIERAKSYADGQSNRILVILSWGLDENAFKLLPDLEFIDYLLHPASHRLQNKITLSNAKIHISNPDITCGLISSASLIIGDFSSLTLECIFLDRHVVFLVDRSIYVSNCDMDEGFFDSSSSFFGVIPESRSRMAIENAITATDFADLVSRFGNDVDGFKGCTQRATFDQAFLPADHDNAALCVDEISKLLRIAEAWAGAGRHAKEVASGIIDSMCFISSSYQTFLRRPADRSGLTHYLRRMAELSGGALERAVSVWHEISRSSEARRRKSSDQGELPRIYFPRAVIDDPVQAAHAHAAEERLSDALHWITKAIELRPGEGEFLRFKASILERMGSFEKALQTAYKAKSHGATPEAISSDINRIHERLISKLKESSRSEDTAKALLAYARLLEMRSLTFRELLKFIGGIIRSYAELLTGSQDRR
jgi:hypothetical protein